VPAKHTMIHGRSPIVINNTDWNFKFYTFWLKTNLSQKIR
jgi:hypothetical protein